MKTSKCDVCDYRTCNKSRFGSLLVCMVFSRDRKKVGPSFLTLFGLQAAEFDLASPEGASKVNLSREKAK